MAINTPDSPRLNFKRSKIITIESKIKLKLKNVFHANSELKNIKNGENYAYFGVELLFLEKRF